MRDDPPPILSGMIEVEIDSQGRLCSFAAMPKQFEERTQPALPVDWNATFSAAGLDLTKFEPAEPLWTWLATSDTRVAWTGTWPDSGRPLRVEAAAWRGKPVGFSLIGPWTKPLRMPPVESAAGEQTFLVLVITIALVLIIGAPLLARRNIKLGKGDRRGAARLAAFIFFTGVSVWLCRGHFVGSLSIAGPFFVAICTAVFYAAVVWTVYVALEPYVRRYWPHALISWTRVLTGQLRDPGVARDVLLGTAFGVGLAVAGGLLNRVTAGPGTPPGLDDVQVLMGIRAGLGEWLANVLHSVRETLLFFFLLFLLRVFLRNRWLAAASFTVILVFIQTARSAQPWTDGAVNTLIFGTIAVIGVRLGLLPLAVGIFVTNVLGAAPLSTHPSAWYFGSTALLLAFVAGLAAWACYVSLAGRRLWREDLFG
jgi:serine/threonine-protein kinase